LPAMLEYSEKKLQEIIEQLDNSFTNVIEFRHSQSLLFPVSKEIPEEVIASIRCSEKVEQVFLYFNNTATIAALRNATYVQKLVSITNEKSVSAPQLT